MHIRRAINISDCLRIDNETHRRWEQVIRGSVVSVDEDIRVSVYCVCAGGVATVLQRSVGAADNGGRG